MAYFEGIKMTGGYGNGPDIISSCSVNANKGEIVSILGLMVLANQLLWKQCWVY